MNLKLIFCFFIIFDSVFTSNILVLYVHEERSHLFSMAPFLESLAKAGHNLTVFDTGSEDEPANLPFNCTIVHVNLPTQSHVEEFVSYFLWRHEPHAAMMAMIQKNGDDEMDRLLLEAGDKFALLLNSEYDLVITDEIFTVHGMTIALMLKELTAAPFIVFATSNVGPESNTAEIAIGHNPIMDATHGTILPSGPTDVFDSSSFYHRLYNFLEMCADMSAFWFIVPKIVGYNTPQKLTSVNFDTSKVMQNAEMHLRDGFDRIGRIVPHGNDYRSVGSHCKKWPKLTGELKTFVEDKTSKGTIYLAFGSILKFDNCPEFVFDSLFSALNEFPEYRIVMSMKPLKNRTLPPLNDHVRIQSWVPQYALLAHEKTKLFMSHGGLKSFKEALCTNTPVLFLPVFAEQGLIARMSIRLGIGSALNKYSLTKQQIVDEFNRLLTNSTFQKNMEKFHEINLDRVIPSLDEGTWFVNKILKRITKFGKRVGNLPNSERSLLFFRRKGILLSSFQFFNMDFAAVVLAVLWIVSK